MTRRENTDHPTPAAKPVRVMVIITYPDSQPDEHKEMIVIFNHIGQGTNYELSLWQTDVQDGEKPVEAAARCINEQIWGHGSKYELEWSLFHSAGCFETETHTVKTYFMPWHVKPNLLRPGLDVYMLEAGLIVSMTGRMTEESLIALQNIPNRTLKTGLMKRDDHAPH